MIVLSVSFCVSFSWLFRVVHPSAADYAERGGEQIGRSKITYIQHNTFFPSLMQTHVDTHSYGLGRVMSRISSAKQNHTMLTQHFCQN